MVGYVNIVFFLDLCFSINAASLPGGLVVRIRRSHRRGPGSIPGQGMKIFYKSLLSKITNSTSGFNSTLLPMYRYI